MSRFTNPFAAANDVADLYIHSVLKLVGDQDPVEILQDLPTQLDRLANEFSIPFWSQPETQGGWSASVVVQHLADSEVVWAWRLRQIVASDRPAIVGYDQDRWAEDLNYSRVPLDLSLAQIRVLRESNLWLLENLSIEQRQRVGVHSERGEETVESMVRLYAGHDLVHRNQIRRVLVAAIERARDSSLLQTERLTLRRFELTDDEFILRLVNDPSFLNNIGDKGVSDLEGARRYLQNGPLASYRANGFGLYGVVRNSDERLMGMCGLVRRDTLDFPDIGYAFLPEFWGQGFAVEAARSTVNEARSLGLERLLAITDPKNDASIRLLLKLGMTLERTYEISEGDEVSQFDLVFS